MSTRPLLTPRRFSIDEYHRLLDKGVLKRGAKTALLDGVVVEAPPPTGRVAETLRRLHRRLAQVLPDGLQLRHLEPLTLSPSTECTAGLAVVDEKALRRTVRHPATARLVVEVGDDGAQRFRTLVLPELARAKVAEVWWVDTEARTIFVSWKPDPASGTYHDALVARAGMTLQSPSLPTLRAPLDEVLGRSP